MDDEDSQDLILIMYYDLPKGNMEYRHQITLTRQDIFLLDDHLTFSSYSIKDEKYCSVEGERGNYVRNDEARARDHTDGNQRRLGVEELRGEELGQF